MTSVEILQYIADCLNVAVTAVDLTGSLIVATTKSMSAWTPFENATLRFCDYFLIILSSLACKMWTSKSQNSIGVSSFEMNLKKFSTCCRMCTLSIQLQNGSFHVVERTRTLAKCKKWKNARAKRANLLFLIVKYAKLWRTCYHNLSTLYFFIERRGLTFLNSLTAPLRVARWRKIVYFSLGVF